VALENEVVQRQLVDIFVTNLADMEMSKRILRKDKNTLDENLNLAIEEQNLQKKFEVRFSSDVKQKSQQHHHTQQQSRTATSWEDPRHIEPMEIDSITRGRQCYGCFQTGHFRQECPHKDIQCRKCLQFGHFRMQCPNVEVHISGNNWQGRGRSANRLQAYRSGSSRRPASRGRGNHGNNYQGQGQPTRNGNTQNQGQGHGNYGSRRYNGFNHQNSQDTRNGHFQRGSNRRQGRRGTRGFRGGRRGRGRFLNNMDVRYDDEYVYEADPEMATPE